MNKTILVVDDSLVERTVLSGFLQNDYNVIKAGSGEEAIEIIRKKINTLCAVIMDVIMPGMNGFETLKKIKSTNAWQHLPVIITTSLDDDESREKAIINGADNFILKPYNKALLLYVVQNTIKLHEAAAVAKTLFRDGLTGLLSRDSFFTEAMGMIKRHEPGYYILSFLDVDNFKVINDQYGTEVGDKVLKYIADSLSGFVAGINGLTCRYMADKFAILYPAKFKDSPSVKEIHIKTTFPDCISGSIRTRIGRYLVNDLSIPISAMFDRAAMAQDSIKNRYDVYIADYTDSMRIKILKEQQVVNNMNDALKNGEFIPWFQPQYNHSTGELIGAEALVRWEKNGEFIAPYEFIPVFERNGFIYEMDKSIWEQVCALLRKWIDEGKNPLPVSINISRKDLFQPQFTEVLCGIVNKYKLPYELIRLEVTESAFADSPIVEKVDMLIHLGFTVEIDDFGNGYSSLNTLKDVPASILKLDMKFFEDTKNTERGGNIIESIVRMAKWIGMSVIAEGVEEKEQADYLKSIGCYYIQGYYYAKPMPTKDYELCLETRNKSSKLDELETLETLDNNEFWNPKSIETLIFNSYVGGACIFEYHNGKTELLRMNEQYTKEMGGLIPPGTQLVDASMSELMKSSERKKLLKVIEEAIETKKEISCDVCISNGRKQEYIRVTGRVIARAGDRYLCYGVVLNVTSDKEANDQLRFLNQIAHDILVVSDSNNAINYILKKVLTYFGSDRTYIMEDSSDKKYMSNTYEICADGILSIRYKRQNLDVGMSGRRNYDALVIDDINTCKACKMPFLNMLHSQDVHSTVIIPLVYDGFIFGTMAIDNPKIIWNQIDRYNVLGDYVAILLNKRDTLAQFDNAKNTITSLMDNTPGGFIRMKLTEENVFVPVYANDGFRNIIGMNNETLMNICEKNILDVVHPDDREIVKSAGKIMLEYGQAESAKFRVHSGNGEYIWLTICGQTTKEISGDTYLNLYLTDVSKDINAENNKKMLLENIPCGVALFEYENDDLHVVHINKKYWSLVDRKSYDYEKISVFEMIHPDDRKYVKREIEKAIHDNRNISIDLRVISGDKTYKAFHVSSNNVHAENGKYMLYSTFTPIVEQAMAIPEVYLDDNDIQAKLEYKINHEKTLSRKTVLIVDDNMIDRAVLTGLLNTDFDVVNAGSGEEAITILKANSDKIAAIVLDILMPDMDGFAVMRQLKATYAFTNIPIIVSTSLEDDETRVKSISYGANGFITKPYNRALLLHSVKNAVRLRYMSEITEHIKIDNKQKKLLDNLPNGAALFEYDGKNFTVIHINKSYWKLVGGKPNGSSTVMDAIHPDDLKKFENELQSAINNRREAHIDIRLICGNGDYRLFHINAYILPETNGIYTLFVSYIPITEQTKKLHEMNFELNTLLYTIPSGVLKYSADDDEKFEYINRNFVESLGYTEESFKKRFNNCFREMIYEEDREEAERQILIQEGKGGIGKFDYRVPAVDGELHWFHDEGVKVMDENGKEWYYVTLVDITEQKETESNLRLAEEEYRVATRHIGQTIGRYNIIDRTLSITEDAEERLDFPKVINGVPYGMVKLGKISPETADAYVAFYENIMRGEKEGTVTFQKLLSNGWRWITEHSTTIFDEKGNPVSAIISCKDVSEHQEKEIAFKKWQQELRNKNTDTFSLYRLNLSKNSSFDSVEGTLFNFDADIDKSISFNERTKDFSMKCVVEEDRERYLSFVNADTMLASYYRGKKSDVIEFRAKISDSEVHWLRLTVDLVEYPNSTDVEAYMMYDDINESKVVELTTKEQAETDPLTGLLNRKTFAMRFDEIIKNRAEDQLTALFLIDMDGFKQVNDNFGHSVGDQVLIDAAKTIRSILYGGDLVCRIGGDEFIVCVRDMPSYDMVLKKAKQICAMTRRNFSFGIQLTVSLGISVFPEDGNSFDSLYQKADKALYAVKGMGKNNCVFYSKDMDNEKSVSAQDSIIKTYSNKNKMLIVDDNKGSRLYLEAIFKNEFDIECFNNGEAALTFLNKHASEIVIVLLDLVMPDVNGFSILDKMRENRDTQLIPVIVVSGIDDRETNLRALRRGAYDFVQKPVDADLLRIRVNSAIERSEVDFLRLKHEILSIEKDEMTKIRKILEGDGTIVVEYEIGNEMFRYDNMIINTLSGTFDTRPLWRIFESDTVSSKSDAEKLKEMIFNVTNKIKKSEGVVMELKTKSDVVKKFRVKVMRFDDDIIMNNRLLITLTDLESLTK